MARLSAEVGGIGRIQPANIYKEKKVSNKLATKRKRLELIPITTYP